jgi:hypothetical protein
MLRELLLAALQESTAGDELNITFGEVVGDRAVVYLHCVPSRTLISRNTTLERLLDLASQMGAMLDVRDRLALSFHAFDAEPTAPPVELSNEMPVSPSADVPVPSGHGNARHDGGSQRQREHGQPGAF